MHKYLYIAPITVLNQSHFRFLLIWCLWNQQTRSESPKSMLTHFGTPWHLLTPPSSLMHLLKLCEFIWSGHVSSSLIFWPPDQNLLLREIMMIKLLFWSGWSGLMEALNGIQLWCGGVNMWMKAPPHPSPTLPPGPPHTLCTPSQIVIKVIQ